MTRPLPNGVLTSSSQAVDFKLIALAVSDIQDAWAHLEPFLAMAVEGSRGAYTLASLLTDAQLGELDLWAVVSAGKVVCLIGTQILEESSGQRVCMIRFITGHSAKLWLQKLLPDMEAYATLNGCSKLAAWARKGWQKLLTDFSVPHVLLEKHLDHGRIKTDDSNEQQARAMETGTREPVEFPGHVGATGRRH